MSDDESRPVERFMAMLPVYDHLIDDEERSIDGGPCPDCDAAIGEEHDDCDVARCLHTGLSRLGCDGEGHDCGQDVWTGRWPGDAECEEFGWYAVGPPWVSCPPGTPGAGPDLNRLATEARWDRDQRRWVKR